MKKLLALVLALVMTLGLATVGTNAALSDFRDADSIDVDYKAAFAVMNAVGVFVGDNGNLNPTGNLTRAQAAKLVAYLDLGESVAEALPKTGSKFTDVPNGAWYTGYVNYMVQAGYTSGTSATTFSPDGELNGYQFGAFLLAVLGYDREIEGMTGSGWETKVAVKMEECGITDGVDKLGSAALTREEAAQFCLNALEADCVQYATPASTIKTSDGTTIVTGGSSATAKGHNGYSYNSNGTGATGTDGVTMQLCEKLYKGDLKIVDTNDEMGRDGNEWQYKTVSIATVTKESADTSKLITSDDTAWQKVDTVIKKFSSSYTEKSGIQVYINGELQANATNAIDVKVGDKVELFLNDSNAKQVDKVVITRYLYGKVSAATVSKTATDGTVSVRVPGVVASFTETDYVTGYADLAKDDVVYFYNGLLDGNKTWHLFKADSFVGQYTSSTNGHPIKYTIGGTAYVINGTVGTITGLNASPEYKTDYTFYLDGNGYIIGSKKVDNASDDYVFVDEFSYVRGNGDLNASKYLQARLVKVDGSTEIVKVKTIKADGNTYTGIRGDAGVTTYLIDWDATLTYGVRADVTARSAVYKYSVNDSSEYTLTVADRSGTNIGNIKAKDPATSTGLTVNDSTVFVVAGTGDNAHKYTAYTGKNNTPTITGAVGARVTNTNGVATYVFVGSFTTSDETDGEKIFVVNTTPYGTDKIGDNEVTVYSVIKDGEATTVNVANDATGSSSVLLITPSYNAAKTIITKIAGASTYVSAEKVGYSWSGNTLRVGLASGGATYNMAADAKVFYVNEDKDVVTPGTASELSKDENDFVYVVTTKAEGDTVDYIVIYDNENGVATLDESSIKFSFLADGAATGFSAYTDSTDTVSLVKLGCAYNVFHDATVYNVYADATDTTATVRLVGAYDSKADAVNAANTAVAGEGTQFSDGKANISSMVSSLNGNAAHDKWFVVSVRSEDGTFATYILRLHIAAKT